MKKLVSIGMMALVLAGCSNSLTVDGHKYEPYGILNSEKQNQQVCYETNTGDVILGLLFIESLAVPVITFGFDYKEPKKLKDKNGNCN